MFFVLRSGDPFGSMSLLRMVIFVRSTRSGTTVVSFLSGFVYLAEFCTAQKYLRAVQYLGHGGLYRVHLPVFCHLWSVAGFFFILCWRLVP